MKFKNLTKMFLVLSSLIVLGFGLTLTSCTTAKSVDVNQDQIYAEYELFYDKNTDKSYASAIFKFTNGAGTQLQLTAPSEVKFGNDIIPFDALLGYYRKEYAGLLNNGTFVFKDVNGKIYTNTVTMARTIENPTIASISRTGAFTYTWIGDNCTANEVVSLIIGNVAVPTNLQLFLQSGGTNLVLPLTQLNQLPVGNAYCILDRQSELTATPTTGATSAGGKVRAKYRTLNKNTVIQ